MIHGLKKKDILLMIMVLFVAFAFYFYQEYSEKSAGNQVVVTVNGEEVGTYDLSEDQTISINHGSNILKIQDKKAQITEADCPDGLCVHQNPISRTNESIICLPNKVVVKIVAGDGAEDTDNPEDVDTVVR